MKPVTKVISGVTIKGIHPLCEAVPEAKEKDFKSLKKSISENGYHTNLPIVVYKGLVIDGRHRLRACEELGVVPTVEEYDGAEDTIAAYIADSSTHIKNLTAGQRAAAAAAMADKPVGGSGANQYSNSANSHYSISREQAATMWGCSAGTISRYRALPEEWKESVRAGMSINKATELIEKQKELDKMTPAQRKKYEADKLKSRDKPKEKRDLGEVSVTEKELLEKLVSMVPDKVKTDLYPQDGDIPSFRYVMLMKMRNAIATSVSGLNKKQSKEILNVSMDLLDYQVELFDDMVRVTRTKAVKSLELKLKKEIEITRKKREEMVLENSVNPHFLFSKAEAKQLNGVLHSDRYPEFDNLTEEVYETIRDRLKRSYKIFRRVMK